MKASELIKALKKLDGDPEIYTEGEFGQYQPVTFCNESLFYNNSDGVCHPVDKESLDDDEYDFGASFTKDMIHSYGWIF